MELFDFILVSILMPLSIPCINVLLQFIAWLIIHTIVIDTDGMIVAWERGFSTHARTHRDLGGALVPGNGWHVVVRPRAGLWLLAHRATETRQYGYAVIWTLYQPRTCMTKKRCKDASTILAILQDASLPAKRTALQQYRVESLDAHRFSMYIDDLLPLPKIEPPPGHFHWQQHCAKSVFDYFQQHGQCTALLCGPPGIGKSSLDEQMANICGRQIMRSIRGFTPTMLGVTFDFVVDLKV